MYVACLVLKIAIEHRCPARGIGKSKIIDETTLKRGVLMHTLPQSINLKIAVMA